MVVGGGDGKMSYLFILDVSLCVTGVWCDD